MVKLVARAGAALTRKSRSARLGRFVGRDWSQVSQGLRVSPLRLSDLGTCSFSSSSSSSSSSHFRGLEATKGLEAEILKRSQGSPDDDTITGTVVHQKDGIVSVTGLRNSKLNDVVELETRKAIKGGSEDDKTLRGLVISMQNDLVHVAVLGSEVDVQLGGNATLKEDESINVPLAKPGDVIDVFGNNIIDPSKPAAEMSKKSILWGNNIKTRGILDRKVFDAQFRTGILSIDTLLPMGLGYRTAIAGDNIFGLREIALQIVSNQSLNMNQIDRVIWLSVGQDHSGVARTANALKANGGDKLTTIISATDNDGWVLQNVATGMACSMAELPAGDEEENVLIVVDNLASIGHAISKLNEAKTLSLTPKTKHSQSHAWLERGGNFINSKSITILGLLPTDSSMESDQVEDMIARDVDSIIFSKGKEIDAIGSKSHFFSGKNVDLKHLVLGSVKAEKSASFARELGFNPDHEDETKVAVKTAAKLRKVFESSIASRFGQATPEEQYFIVFAAVHGFFGRDNTTVKNVESFLEGVFERATIELDVAAYFKAHPKACDFFRGDSTRIKCDFNSALLNIFNEEYEKLPFME